MLKVKVAVWTYFPDFTQCRLYIFCGSVSANISCCKRAQVLLQGLR